MYIRIITGSLHVSAENVRIRAVRDGSVLLRGGASAYIVVGIAAFAVGVTVTMICIRCKKKKTIRMEDAEDKEEST